MKFSRLLRISRPRFWIYEIGPYILGIAAAAGANPFIWLSLPVIIFLIFFTYPANIYIYGINDIYDYETDKLNPKKQSYESLVQPEEQKKLFSHIRWVCLPFLIYALITVSGAPLIALVAFFFFAGFYSAGPIRAKARPVLDSIFSAGHYVATAVFSYLLVAQLLTIPFSWSTLIACAAAGMCWAIAMHAYSAVPDIKADSEAGLSTIATSLGGKNTILLCAALYVLSAVLALPYLGPVSSLIGAVYVAFMLVSLNADEHKLFKLYTYFPIINTVSGMIIFFSILFL